MGSSTIIDIILSIVVGGVLMLMIVNLRGTMTQANYLQSEEYSIQTNTTTLIQMIEDDFRRIAYCANTSNYNELSGPACILYGTPDSICFVADINADGNMDTVRYGVGHTTDATVSSTPNPRDVPIYRYVTTAGGTAPYSTGTTPLLLGVTQFSLQYFAQNLSGTGSTGTGTLDTLATPVTSASGVYEIELTLRVENMYSFDTVASSFSYAYWRQMRLASRNIKNR
jgi:hypothetical protein